MLLKKVVVIFAYKSYSGVGLLLSIMILITEPGDVPQVTVPGDVDTGSENRGEHI